MAAIFDKIADVFKSGDDAVMSEVAKVAANAGEILNAVGGADNVKEVTNCATRLRLKLKDLTKVDENAAKAAGVIGVVKPEDEEDGLHVVLGTEKIQAVAEAFKKLL